MSNELEEKISMIAARQDEIVNELRSIGLRVDDFDIVLRTRRYQFADHIAVIITTVVGVIMALFTILSAVNIFYG